MYSDGEERHSGAGHACGDREQRPGPEAECVADHGEGEREPKERRMRGDHYPKQRQRQIQVLEVLYWGGGNVPTIMKSKSMPHTPQPRIQSAKSCMYCAMRCGVMMMTARMIPRLSARNALRSVVNLSSAVEVREAY